MSRALILAAAVLPLGALAAPALAQSLQLTAGASCGESNAGIDKAAGRLASFRGRPSAGARDIAGHVFNRDYYSKLVDRYVAGLHKLDDTALASARRADPHHDERQAITDRVIRDFMMETGVGSCVVAREIVARVITRTLAPGQIAEARGLLATPEAPRLRTLLGPAFQDPKIGMALAALHPWFMADNGALNALYARIQKATAHLPPEPDADDASTETPETGSKP